MDKILLFSAYLISTLVAILVSLKLLGFNNLGYKGIIIGLANGINDYIVKEILVDKAHLVNGVHFISGTLVVFVLSYFLLRIRKRDAFIIPILAYIISAVSEVMVLILLISIFNKSVMEKLFLDPFMQAIGGIVAQTPVLILLLLLHFKYKEISIRKIKFINYRR